MIRPVGGGPPPEVPKSGSPSPQVQQWMKQLQTIMQEIQNGSDNVTMACHDLGRLEGQMYASSPSQYRDALLAADGAFTTLSAEGNDPDITKATDLLQQAIQQLQKNAASPTPLIGPPNIAGWINSLKAADDSILKTMKWPSMTQDRLALFHMGFVQGLMDSYPNDPKYSKISSLLKDAVTKFSAGGLLDEGAARDDLSQIIQLLQKME